MTSHGGGSGGGGGGPRRQEAERWLGVAGKLLEARDFEGCKQFVDQSVSADPHVPGAEELVAAAEVLQSVQLRLINGHPDYYAVLGLDSSLPSSLDPAAVALHYQRLSLLLVRDPPTPAFTDAAKLVSDAWNVLADPASKALFDKELELARPKLKPRSPSPPPPPLPPPVSSSPRKTPVKVKPAKLPRVSKTPKSARVRGESSLVKSGKSVAKPTYFWTMCTTCCHVHQYGRLCEGQYLLCHSCRRPFFAAAMNEPPPIVPDTDMYYCTWGFFPLGFPGGPGYGGMYGLGSQLGTASLPAAQPAVVPAKIGGERVNGSGIGTGSGASFTPGKRGRGRPRKNPPVTGTPATPGSSLVKVPSTQPSLVSPKLGQRNVNVTRTPNTFPGKRGRGRGRGRPPGRPRKNPPSSGMHAMPIINTQTSVILLKKGGDSVNGTGTGNGTPNTFPAKRGPGRPRKNYPSPATFRTPESGLVDVPIVASESAAVMSSISWGSTEGTVPGTAEGNVPGTTEGTVPGPAEGSVHGPAEGTVPGPTEGTAPGTTEGAVDSPSSQPVKRGRGRPRKNEADSASYTKKMVAKKRVNATMETVVVDMN